MLLATDADRIHDEVDAALGGDHTVVRVHAGAEVLAAVGEHGPVLVVLDLQIGNMGGMATCLDLRLEERAERIPPQRVVMLLDREADVFLARRAEADAWVSSRWTRWPSAGQLKTPWLADRTPSGPNGWNRPPVPFWPHTGSGAAW